MVVLKHQSSGQTKVPMFLEHVVVCSLWIGHKENWCRMQKRIIIFTLCFSKQQFNEIKSFKASEMQAEQNLPQIYKYQFFNTLI